MTDGTDVTEHRETDTAQATLSAPESASGTAAAEDTAPVATDPAIAADGSADGTAAAPVPEIVRRRLAPAYSVWNWRGWAATGWVVVIAGILRFYDLTKLKGFIFDEVYYAKEGGQLLGHGVEWTAPTSGGVGSAGYVVHPPLGKWLIAAGIKIFGYNEFGWRFASAVAGTLAVLIITRVAIRMFRSIVLGCMAGLFMAMDGMELVLSRFALLDIFVMFFVLAAFSALLIDRDRRRLRWLRALESGIDPARGGRASRPRLSWSGVPWFRLASAVLIGCACAVKWSAVYYIPVFVGLFLLWEVGTRRSAGVRHPWRDTFLGEFGSAIAYVVLPVLVYLASWTGWFISDEGWDRHYLLSQGKSEPPVLGPLYNLWHYHSTMWEFHTHLTTSHPYQSWPWQWLLLARPVAFYWSGNPGCGGSNCAAEVLLLGTPLLWWSFIPALLALAWLGFSRRDWRALAIWLTAAAGIAPWFYYEIDNRTMFYFYAIPAEPFLILAVVYALGALITPSGLGRAGSFSLTLPVPERRMYGTIVVAGFVVLLMLCFFWYYPIYVGQSITYDSWWRHMLLGNRWV